MRHCGHPTALWPYFGHKGAVEPEDKNQFLLHGGWGLGRAFQTLKMAQEAVEAELRKAAA